MPPLPSWRPECWLAFSELRPVRWVHCSSIWASSRKTTVIEAMIQGKFREKLKEKSVVHIVGEGEAVGKWGAGGVVWLICFSCFAAHLIGLILDYITVLDLCNISKFCKRSRLVSPYEGSLLNFLIFWWQIFHESGQCFWLRCNFIPTYNRLTLLRKKNVALFLF